MSGKRKNHWPVTRHQLRAGRALADLRLRQFAELVGMSCTTIHQIEKGHTKSPLPRTVAALRDTLSSLDIEFRPGGWVRLKTDRDHGCDREPAEPMPDLPVASTPANDQQMSLEQALDIVLTWLRSQREGRSSDIAALSEL